MPSDGHLFKADWLLQSASGETGKGQIVQSWDTAIKKGSANNF